MPVIRLFRLVLTTCFISFILTGCELVPVSPDASNDKMDISVLEAVSTPIESIPEPLVAAVVPADQSYGDDRQLRDYCREHLERNDVPEFFQVLDEIPKTISEKPIEKACIELLPASVKE